MENSIIKLHNEFIKIRNMGYVPSVYQHRHSAGSTFERLLGKQSDELFWPDYEGIEIKTKKGYSKTKIGLFTANPDGKYLFVVQDLLEKFGKEKNGTKSFMLEVNAYDYSFYNNHKYKLVIDYKQQVLCLKVYDFHNNLVYDDITWSFELLKERINLKMQTLAFIKCCTKIKNNLENYWYYRMDIYQELDFTNFLKQLEKGNISIRIGIGIFKTGKRVGQVHNHGMEFSIQEEHLKELYNKVIDYKKIPLVNL